MAFKNKKTILIKDPQLRKIRNNFRRLIKIACRVEQDRIHDKDSELRENVNYYDDLDIRRQAKELNEQIWTIEQPLRDSILECPVCFKSDKDMTYNPVRKVWYCTDCYEKLRKGNIERGTPEESP